MYVETLDSKLQENYNKGTIAFCLQKQDIKK